MLFSYILHTPHLDFRASVTSFWQVFSFQWSRRWSLWGVSTSSPCWSYSNTGRAPGRRQLVPQCRGPLERSDYDYDPHPDEIPSVHFNWFFVVKKKKDSKFRFKCEQKDYWGCFFCVVACSRIESTLLVHTVLISFKATQSSICIFTTVGE